MKYFIVFIILLSTFIFISCSKESVVAPTSNSKGSVSLSLAKENIPNNVAVVRMILKRNGYQNITANLNIQSDSSANLTINSIAVGVWHLTVDALNTSGIVIYSGETDVQVLENQTAPIQLTLLPISNGEAVGSIQINVTWGTLNAWSDSPNSPILTGSQVDLAGVGHPFVILQNNVFVMYYTSIRNNSVGYIYKATSANLINWTKSTQPILSPTSTKWFTKSLGLPKVLYADGHYLMFFDGRSFNTNYSMIGRAISPDGGEWLADDQPILTQTLSWERDIFPTSVLYVNNKYYLYYSSWNSSNNVTQIGLATSTDGINFIKQTNPILLPNFEWEGNALTSLSVIYDNNKFIGIYFDNNGTVIGQCESADGISWSKNVHPIFNVSNCTNHWAMKFHEGQLIKINSDYKIFYSGSTSDDYYKIGLINKN